jgi:hypothetical protein
MRAVCGNKRAERRQPLPPSGAHHSRFCVLVILPGAARGSKAGMNGSAQGAGTLGA